MRRRQPVSVGLLVLFLAIGLFVVAREPAQMPGRLPVIVDTDAGTDDLLAIAYLLNRPEIDVQLVATVNGLAHAETGARNVLRLLRAANRRIPVYVGADQPLEGRDAFPAAWRQQADEMAALPPLLGRRPRPDAVSAILDRLRSSTVPVAILALGPLTNLAQAVTRDPRAFENVAQVVVMGGAIDVPGNAPDNSPSPIAEWNMYVDPTAASLVLKAGLPLTLVPLDATNRVPIDRSFVKALSDHPLSPLGGIAVRLLEANAEMILNHSYFAWDPLAAVALTDPSVVTTKALELTIVRTGDERGRLVAGDGDPNAAVAWSASPATFRRDFFASLTRR